MPSISFQFDVVVVGSGPAGVSAAYPLVEAGLKVAIIDGGLDGRKKDNVLNDFSDINLSEKSNAYGLIRNNSYIFNKTYQLLKIKSKIEILQSLAKGGLSELWSGISDFFSPTELERVGIPVHDIQREYKEVSKRIKLNFKLPLDLHSKLVMESYKSNKDYEIYPLPSAESYFGSLSIDDLKRYKNFTYIPNNLVIEVKQEARFVEIKSMIIDKSSELITNTKFLILGAGSFNTTRILLRSFGLFNYKTSFLTKPHYVIVCLHLRTLIRRMNFKKLKLGQLAISSKRTDQGLSTFFIQLFRFNPQALHKALKYIPLPKFITLIILRIIGPSLVIADVRLPAFESKNKFCSLKKDITGKDFLEVVFKETEDELGSHKNELNRIKKQLKGLGLFPLKMGSDYITAHYAGGVPFNDTKRKLFVNTAGQLHQAKKIYISDSSTWRALPGRSPALTIMANASRVGKNVLEEFRLKSKKL